MENLNVEQLKERFRAWRDTVFQKTPGEESKEVGREKIVVFMVALILALGLWLMVNLSEEYTINLNLPIEIGNLPGDQALAQDLPDHASVSVTGEGWNLLTLYNTPPPISVDVMMDQIDLWDQVRQQMNNQPVTVTSVQPVMLSVELEEKITRQVPVISNVDISFRDRYNLMGEARIVPDSIAISGAASVVENVTLWHTEPVELDDVHSEIVQEIQLQEANDLITLSRNTVTYRAEVVEYTEGEVRVPILTRDLPEGRSVSFSPSNIRVRFDIPIGEYRQVEESMPVIAYVSYDQIRSDSTGFVTPQFELADSSLNIDIRSHQPSEVAYFIVIR